MSKKIWLKSILGILFLFTLSAPGLHAQESATIQATATVISALSVIGIHDLMFETVIPGTPKTVDKATIGRAGEFQLTGHDSAEVTLEFTLPDSLILLADTTRFMIVAFSNTDAAYDDGTGGGQTSPAGIINPNGPTTERLGTAGQMEIWLGGTVTPTITQTGGDYSADVTLTVTYTGN